MLLRRGAVLASAFCASGATHVHPDNLAVRWCCSGAVGDDSALRLLLCGANRDRGSTMHHIARNSVSSSGTMYIVYPVLAALNVGALLYAEY